MHLDADSLLTFHRGQKWDRGKKAWACSHRNGCSWRHSLCTSSGVSAKWGISVETHLHLGYFQGLQSGNIKIILIKMRDMFEQNSKTAWATNKQTNKNAAPGNMTQHCVIFLSFALASSTNLSSSGFEVKLQAFWHCCLNHTPYWLYCDSFTYLISTKNTSKWKQWSTSLVW